jgi:hypothetical protein
MAKKKNVHPGDITRVLSQSMAKGSAPPARKSVVQDDVTYNAANQHIQYWASSHRQVRTGALIDPSAMEELQVMMFGSLTAQDDKLMFNALTAIKLLIFQLLQLEPP